MSSRFRYTILVHVFVFMFMANLDAQVQLENSANTSNTAITHNYSYTVGSGSERLMIVGVSIFSDYSSKFVNSMTYNGSAMTFQTASYSPDNKVRTEVWFMKNPPSGNHVLSTTFNTTTRQITGITSFEGVDQTTPISTTATFAQNSGDPSVVIASELGGMVWDVVTRDNNGSWTPGTNQTERWDASVGTDVTSAGSTELGATSVTMSWSSDDNGQQIVQIAAAIKPSTSPPEICGNSIDDNNDGRTDEDIPGGVGGDLLLWLKADVGFSATTWEDQGPKNNDATVYGDPTQVSNSLNFNPGINFDGDDHVEVDLPELVFSSGYHHVIIFAVYEPNTAATDIGMFGNQSATSVQNIYLQWNQVGHGNGSDVTFTPFGAQPHLITMIIDEEDNVGGGANESKLYRNGTLDISFAMNETSASGVDQDFHIGKGGSHPTSSKYFQGDIHEIIIYYEWDGNAALTAAEIEQVQSYLATKYGITLPHDYVDSQ